MEKTACNLCGSTATEPFATVPDLLLARLTTQATLVRCLTCGLVYQNPRPTLAEIGQHYPPEYEPFVDQAEKRKTNWFLQQAIAYGIRKRCRFVTRHKTSGKILDIGCAVGTFLLGMQAQGGWQTYGVELSHEVARFARERHHLDVFAGTLEEANFPDQSFDAVTMWDVLEHIHDPAATLCEIRRILKPDGVVVIRVPNLASWDAKFFGKAWAGLDAPRHLYVFTPTTLSQLLRKSGFVTVAHSSAIGSYVTFVLSLRFWLMANNFSENLQNKLVKILYHPVSRLISAPFFYLPNLALRGPLLVTTAKKATN
ncbi:MAG: class I SAM-dependent methyltransferase [Caldilineaceae bacterium]